MTVGHHAAVLGTRASFLSDKAGLWLEWADNNFMTSDYWPHRYAQSSSAASDAEAWSYVMPVAGTLKEFYMEMELPHGTTNSSTLTVRKNAVDTAQALTFTIGEANQTIVQDVAFNAGDIITVTHVRTVAAGGAGGGIQQGYVQWEATGEPNLVAFHFGSADFGNTTAARYHAPTVTGSSISAVGEAETQSPWKTRLTGIRVKTTNGNVTADVVCTVMVDGVATAIACTITSGQSTGSMTGASVAIARGARVTVRTVAASAVAATLHPRFTVWGGD